MAEYIEKEAKTVESAIEEALNEMNIGKDDADIEVLDEGSKGLFGLIGGRNALVRVYKKVDYEEIIKSFLYPVFDVLGIDGDIDITVENNVLNIKLSAENIGIIIGRRGETLDALQYLLGLAVNKQSDRFMRVTLDVCNYREKREETLIRLAKRLADKVERTRKNITLEPMNPYERRIIHATLQDYGQVETYSIGDEPNRKVVIRYKKEYRKV
ncbi:MAG: RNA-binding cell elongation regulator Jag/EloR [Bacillota bacterium]|nr:RNA-binding cell elongation regulator Jag/EloR [Bacillota bacterium]